MAEPLGDKQARRGKRRNGDKPTVVDVARHAGVSPMTVSRVINRSPNVQPDTRAKVESAIRALQYVPNVAARTLAGSGQCRIAMLYSNPSAAYLSEFLAGSVEGAAASDAQLIVEHWSGRESAEDVVRRLRLHRIDAVSLPPPLCEDAGLLEALGRQGLPLAQVATGHPLPGHAAVTIDDEAAAGAMTAHFLALGHRRIGFITGDPQQSASGVRQAGYERALREAGLAVDPTLIAPGDYTYRSGLSAAEFLLDLSEAPSAIFASNDDMAAAVVAVAHRRGLSVPADLSVGGFDDTAMATTIWPELTTVRQPIAAMARAAVDLLARAVRPPAAVSPQHCKLEFELIARNSSRAPGAAN